VGAAISATCSWFIPVPPQLRERLDRPSLRRSDAKRKRREAESAAPRKKDAPWLLHPLLRNPRPMMPILPLKLASYGCKISYCSIGVST
jgi:hypothetical protein